MGFLVVLFFLLVMLPLSSANAPASCFKILFKKKEMAAKEFPTCNDLHLAVCFNTFQADMTGKNEYHDYAWEHLKQIREKAKKPGVLVDQRLNYRIDCYYHLLVCGEHKHLRTDEYSHFLGLEGILLAKRVHLQAEKRDVELYNTVEGILGVCGTIFAEKAATEKRSLQSLKRTIDLINAYRTKRLEAGMPFVSVININGFAAIVEENSK